MLCTGKFPFSLYSFNNQFRSDWLLGFRRSINNFAIIILGQQSLIYNFVSRGTVVILAEYTEFTGNFTTIASKCLQKLPTTNNKLTYNCDGHTFNYLIEDGFMIYEWKVC
ncbi:putative Longin domain-containing protein [Helianthus annuus]|nr:putative Longin domain-containing protein [Helianthus annuus]